MRHPRMPFALRSCLTIPLGLLLGLNLVESQPVAAQGQAGLGAQATARPGTNSNAGTNSNVGPEYGPQPGQSLPGDALGPNPTLTVMPCPFSPLTDDHETYLNQLLDYWENSTNQVERFRCEFARWDYDPVFGPKPDPNTGEMQAAVICKGEIKYQSPDKAMYEVTGKWTYQVNDTENGPQAEYVQTSEDLLEKWISDGKATYEYDYATQQVKRRQLPPEMQGRTIADGPIPFVFGAKADKTRERYWIRVITPKKAQDAGEYWLEAFPKFPADAQEFSRVKVILNQDFLVQAVELYAADYDEVRNRKSQTFMFENQKFNETNLNPFRILDRPFYQPAIPNGWKQVDADLAPATAQGGPLPAGDTRR